VIPVTFTTITACLETSYLGLTISTARNRVTLLERGKTRSMSSRSRKTKASSPTGLSQGEMTLIKELEGYTGYRQMRIAIGVLIEGIVIEDASSLDEE